MKILFITDKYYPIPYANAICIQNVAASFVQDGCETHILAFDDPSLETPKLKDGVKIYTVNPELRLKNFYYASNFPKKKKSKYKRLFASVLSKSQKLLNWRRYPLSSMRFTKRIETKIEELNAMHNYNVVVSAYNPFEGVLAGMNFKINHPDIKWILYNIDYMPDAIKRNVSKEKIKKSCNKWESMFYDAADRVIVMKSNLNRSSMDLHKKYNKKIVISDLPLLNSNLQSINQIKTGYLDRNVENWVYAGSLNSQHYNPELLFTTFLNLPERNKRILHIFGRGELLQLCKKYELRSKNRIIIHDYIPHDELKKVLIDADILVSLKNSDQISAKIFEYMSYSKKIIHFSGHDDDPDARYICEYDNGLVISSNANDYDNVTKIIEFLKKDLRNITNINLEMNKPSFTKNLIKNSCKDKVGDISK